MDIEEKMVDKKQEEIKVEEKKKEDSILKKYVIPALLIFIIIGAGYVVYVKKIKQQPEDTRPAVKKTAQGSTNTKPSVSGTVNTSPSKNTGKGGTTVPTPSSAPVEVKTNGISATYYDDLNFLGSSQTRIDDEINFDWKAGQPIDKIEAESFSVRWNGLILAPTSETYTIYAEADDGVRLWINGRQVINEWKDHSLAEYKASVSFAGGKFYPIKLEYFNLKDLSTMRLSWSSTSTPRQVIPNSAYFMNKTGSGLKGTYFSDPLFTNKVDTRTDTELAFNLKDKKLNDKVDSAAYSVRWEGKLSAKYPQPYTFYVKVNGGVRIWIENKLVLDKADEKKVTDFIFEYTMKAETLVDIKVEYTHSAGDPVIILGWESRSQRYQTVPVTSYYPIVRSE